MPEVGRNSRLLRQVCRGEDEARVEEASWHENMVETGAKRRVGGTVQGVWHKLMTGIRRPGESDLAMLKVRR